MLLKLNYQYKYLRLFLSVQFKTKKQQKNEITNECYHFNLLIIITTIVIIIIL